MVGTERDLIRMNDLCYIHIVSMFIDMQGKNHLPTIFLCSGLKYFKFESIQDIKV